MEIKEILEKSKCAYLVDLGNAYVLHRNPSESSVADFRVDLKKLFKDCPKITKIEEIETKRHPHEILTSLDKNKHTLQIYPPIHAEIRMQIKDQTWIELSKTYIGDEVDTTEEMGLIYDGSYFLAYREVDVKNITPINDFSRPGLIDVRDLLLRILKNHGWEIEIVPPSPLRQSFVIYFLKKDDSRNIEVPKIFPFMGNVHIVLSEPTNVAETMFSIFSEVYRWFRSYYDAVYVKKQMDFSIEKLSSDHEKLITLLREYHTAKSFDFLKRRKYRIDIRKKIIDVYFSLGNYSKYQRDFVEEKNLAQMALTENRLLSPIANELSAALTFQEFQHAPYMESIRHAEKEIEVSTISRTMLIAAVIGGLIGALIGKLLI